MKPSKAPSLIEPMVLLTCLAVKPKRRTVREGSAAVSKGMWVRRVSSMEYT